MNRRTSISSVIMTHASLRRAPSLVVAVIVLALAPAAAEGHAAFQDASPEPGTRLSAAPAQITLAFTEPLNRRLTTARIVNARTGRRVAARVSVEGRSRLLLRPRRRLPTGAFRVEWHTVSILDGHALEGSFGFGVRTSAIGGEQQLERSPLARDGWLRVALRTVWYAALFFFGGGLLCALALRSSNGPAGWLLAGDGAHALTSAARSDAALRRIWGRTRTAGWVAVAAGIGVALAETEDAAGSVSWHSIDAYLLSTVSGGARALAVAGVALAAVLTGRAWRLAAVALLGALAAVAVAGHANSASPRALALFTDWVHLVAGTAWVGGIAQIVATWLPGIARFSAGERRHVIANVLDRFGTLALPAAATVVIAGALNALVELGRVSELWGTAYGRVLMVKIALVAALIAASYTHVYFLRPRVLAAPSGYSPAELRHWRLLRSQPALAACVLAAGALLAVFPLPPRQLLERAEAGGSEGGARPVAAASLRPPRPRELAVAEEAGPWIAAAWADPSSRTGTVRLFDYKVRPVAATINVARAVVRPCGRGCATFRTRARAANLQVTARSGSRTYHAVIPIRWDPNGAPAAQRILARAVAAVDRLHSQRIFERLSGGFGGPPAISRYRVSGRHDYAIVSRGGGASETIAIGRRTWVRQPDGSWQVQVDTPVDTRELMPWWAHRTGVRLLDLHAVRGRRIADLGLAEIPRAGDGPPFWFRLRIDLASMRVLAMRMIAPAHFMDQRYHAFNAPVQIRPPVRRR
jgi:copper transport protein